MPKIIKLTDLSSEEPGPRATVPLPEDFEFWLAAETDLANLTDDDPDDDDPDDEPDQIG
jgi:hypothetical protein